MRTSLHTLALLALLLAPLWASAAAPDAALNPGKAERGWFFYEDPPKPVEPLKPDTSEKDKPASVKPEPKRDAPEKNPCLVKETWTADKCGFVDPGKDFEFQSKQRDALMQAMAMDGGDVRVVEAFQRYNKWILDRAILVANTWRYNLVQSPDLDATVNAPITEFGLKLATEAASGNRGEIFRLLAEDGMLLFFTRTDCAYCHAMVPAVQSLSRDTGIPVWNTPLDNKCLPAFGDKCHKNVITPAQALQVKQVPSVVLFVKPNTWIRVSTGVTQIETMKSRIAGFYAATRTAILKGAVSSIPGRAPVDFGGQIDGSGPRLPDASAIEQSLLTGQ